MSVTIAVMPRASSHFHAFEAFAAFDGGDILSSLEEVARVSSRERDEGIRKARCCQLERGLLCDELRLRDWHVGKSICLSIQQHR